MRCPFPATEVQLLLWMEDEVASRPQVMNQKKCFKSKDSFLQSLHNFQPSCNSEKISFPAWILGFSGPPPNQPPSKKKLVLGEKNYSKNFSFIHQLINQASKIGVVDLPLASKEVLRLTLKKVDVWLHTSHVVKFTGPIILMRSYNKYTYIRYIWLCGCGSIAWYMTAFFQSLLKGSILFHFVGQHMVCRDSSKHNDQTVLNESR